MSLQVFDGAGEPALTFGCYGTDQGQFDCLAGVHITAQVITLGRYELLRCIQPVLLFKNVMGIVTRQLVLLDDESFRTVEQGRTERGAQ